MDRSAARALVDEALRGRRDGARGRWRPGRGGYLWRDVPIRVIRPEAVAAYETGWAYGAEICYDADALQPAGGAWRRWLDIRAVRAAWRLLRRLNGALWHYNDPELEKRAAIVVVVAIAVGLALAYVKGRLAL